MTNYYYAVDVQIDHYIGCGQYDETVFRTIELEIDENTKEIDEEYFEQFKEQLIKNAIQKYDSMHKAKISKVTRIRKAAVIGDTNVSTN